jgi:hypothetical protein
MKTIFQNSTRALPVQEKASIPSSAKGEVRCLYLVPVRNGEKTPPIDKISITGLPGNYQARLLGKDQALNVTTNSDAITWRFPTMSLVEACG